MADILTHESLYRGKPVLAKRANAKICIMGAGALGSRLADTLAVQGYTPTVVDFDKVERHNLGTQSFGPTDIGKLKATQTANNIIRRLGVKAVAIDKKVTPDNAVKMVKGFDLVVDVFDNAESRQLLVDACKSSKVPCLHAGMSGDGFAEIEWNENYHTHPDTAPVGDAPCEYPLAVNLVLFTVAITAEVINFFFDKQERRSIHFTLKDMHVHKL